MRRAGFAPQDQASVRRFRVHNFIFWRLFPCFSDYGFSDYRLVPRERRQQASYKPFQADKSLVNQQSIITELRRNTQKQQARSDDVVGSTDRGLIFIR
jgi:hypothetical protein